MIKKNLKQLLVFYVIVGHIFLIPGWLWNEFINQPKVYVMAAPEQTEEAAPVPTPEPTQEPKTQEQEILDYIKEVFGKDYEAARAIATCESRLNHDAMNDNTTWGGVGRDWGIFQINDYYHADKGDIPNLTWKQNVRMAKQIFDASDWYAWTCYKTGAWLNFI